MDEAARKRKRRGIWTGVAAVLVVAGIATSVAVNHEQTLQAQQKKENQFNSALHKYIENQLSKEVPGFQSGSFSGQYATNLTLKVGNAFSSQDTSDEIMGLDKTASDYSNECTNLEIDYGTVADFETANIPDVVIHVVSNDGNATYSNGDLTDFTGEKYNITNFPAWQQQVDQTLQDASTSNSEPATATSLTDEQKIQAWDAAKSAVKQQLKSPSTAKFPWYSPNFVNVMNGKVVVVAYVDAENGFGAKIRADFEVDLDGNLNVLNVDVQQ